LDNFIYDNESERSISALEDELKRYQEQNEAERQAIDSVLDAFETASKSKIDAIDAANEANQKNIEAQIKGIEDSSEAYQLMVEKQIAGLQAEGEAFDAQIESKRVQIEDLQKTIENNGTLTLMAMERIDQEGDNLYQKLVEWNKIYGSGIEEDILGPWQQFKNITIDNNSVLETVRNTMQEILNLSQQIASAQASISSISGLSGISNNVTASATGIREYFESMGASVNYDKASDSFTLGNQYGTTGSFSAGDYLYNSSGSLTATQKQLQELMEEIKNIPNNISHYDKGGYIDRNQIALIHKGERVLSPAQTKTYDAGNVGGLSFPSTFDINDILLRSVDRANNAVIAQIDKHLSTLDKLTGNSFTEADSHDEYNFYGVTSEDFINNQLPRTMKGIADGQIDSFKHKLNMAAQARGVVGNKVR
jgi:hypothetical protein